MKSGSLEVPVEQIKVIKKMKNILNNISSISARKLSSIVGKIIPLKSSFGNICQKMTRRLSIQKLEFFAAQLRLEFEGGADFYQL